MTQIRINVLNLYTGSLAFTTFFSRIFNFEPGRCWWVILLTVLSMILMFNHVLENIWSIMIGLSVFTFSWMMSVLSYLFFNYKCFNFSSEDFYFQKGTIPEYNFIGLVSVSVALVIGIPMALGWFGPFSATIASMVAGAVAFAMVPMMTFIMHLSKRKLQVNTDSSIATTA